MRDWLAIRGSQPSPVFTQIRKDGLIKHGGFSTWSTAKRPERRRQQAASNPWRGMTGTGHWQAI
jgi:hypothetical protein